MTNQSTDKWWLESAMKAADPGQALTTQDIDWDKGAAAELRAEFDGRMADHILELVHRVLDLPEATDNETEEENMEQAMTMSGLVHYALVRHLAADYRVKDLTGPPSVGQAGVDLAMSITKGIEAMAKTHDSAKYLAMVQLEELAASTKALAAAQAPLFSMPMVEGTKAAREALGLQHDILVSAGQQLAKHYGLDFGTAQRFA